LALFDDNKRGGESRPGDGVSYICFPQGDTMRKHAGKKVEGKGEGAADKAQR